jgi:hypothetical protein
MTRRPRILVFVALFAAPGAAQAQKYLFEVEAAARPGDPMGQPKDHDLSGYLLPKRVDHDHGYLVPRRVDHSRGYVWNDARKNPKPASSSKKDDLSGYLLPAKVDHERGYIWQRAKTNHNSGYAFETTRPADKPYKILKVWRAARLRKVTSRTRRTSRARARVRAYSARARGRAHKSRAR